MIDYENYTFGLIYNAVMAYDNNIYVTSEASKAPASFPCVFVEQTDRYNPEQYEQVSTRKEIASRAVTTVWVYSNKLSGKRQEAKAILAVIHDALRNDGFRQTTESHRDDLVDSNNKSLYALMTRYERLFVAE